MIDWRFPHDPDAEAEVIGWMLAWPSERYRLRSLAAEDFYVPLWQRAFTELEGTSERVSPAMLASKIGCDVDRLVAAQVEAPVGTSAAESVALLALRRRALALGADAQRLARDPDADEAELIDVLRVGSSHLTLPAREVPPPEDVETFVKGATEPDFLVEGVLERRDRVLLVGAEGLGKSTLQRQIAVQCAAGLHPFRPRPTPPLKVLIVDLESGDAMVRRKMRPLWLSARQENPDADPANLRVVVRSEGVDLTKRSGRVWMTEILHAVTPDLVCLGPLYKTYSGDMNEESTARQVALLIDEWRAEFGCAWILETHAPHGEVSGRRAMRPIGSSLWLRWPEVGIGLRETDSDEVVTTSYFRRARDARDWPRRFRKGGQWPWTGEFT